MVDSYRPPRRLDCPDRGGARPLSLQDRVTFTSGGGDSYRPNDAPSQHQSGGQNRGHGEFTFSAGGPAPSFPPARSAAHTRPGRKPRRIRGDSRQRDSERNPNPTTSQPAGRRNQNNFQRGGRRPTYRKKAPHERALLQARDDTGSETLGVTDGPNKFLNLDDLSEDASDMDLNTDKTSGEDGSAASDSGPNHKTARRESTTRADGDSVPKWSRNWSNPDPYTVLPPPDETTGKKRDVVKLIRKAKNQASEKTASNNAVAENYDFISFGDEDEEDDSDNDDGEIDDVEEPPLAWASVNGNYPVLGSLNEAVPSGPSSMPARPVLPPRPQHPGPKHKRKRGELEGGIKQEWLADLDTNPTPWATSDYTHLRDDMTKWLHNEIMDFYDFVKPDTHERSVRHNLINRIEAGLGTRHFPRSVGHVLCFGSFPAGLYLPTADMDLVFVSDHFRNGGQPVFNLGPRQITNELWKAARKLENKGLAVDITVIGRAKVPIIKFVDRITGIKVDLSFENLTGLEAQETYKDWTTQHPDMLFMVALVKQFLAMRGLNDVHLGGLGGFSVICLVVSFLQLQPKPANLGEMFLNLLDYYGNKFNLARQRITMKPPRLVNKTQIGIDNRPEKPDGLSIQDPNRADNNISGGSHKVKQIFQAFSQAHKVLKQRLDALGAGMDGNSALEAILGGNYEEYTSHRAHILKVQYFPGYYDREDNHWNDDPQSWTETSDESDLEMSANGILLQD